MTIYDKWNRRTPRGVRGLKLISGNLLNKALKSHSARGAWIETINKFVGQEDERRRTPRGVRGLKRKYIAVHMVSLESHSARGAWIETRKASRHRSCSSVALREGCVD